MNYMSTISRFYGHHGLKDATLDSFFLGLELRFYVLSLDVCIIAPDEPQRQ
jgi:hypothetical protein